MKIDNSFKPFVQSNAESADSAEEKSSAQSSSGSQTTDTIEDASVSGNNFDYITGYSSQELSVIRQLAILGVDEPTKEQIEAGVKIATEPAAQQRLQQELSVARQLAMIGIDNPTREQMDAALKIATNKDTQDSLQNLMGILKQKEIVGVAGKEDTLGALLEDIINTKGSTPWSPFDAVTNALKGNGTYAPAPTTPQTGGSSSTGGSTNSGTPSNTPTTSGGTAGPSSEADPGAIPRAGSSNQDGGETPADDGAVSDPSEWAPWPGESGGQQPESGEGYSTEKVHVYHSEDSGKTWEDRGVQWSEYPPTQVEVEAPDSGGGDSGEAGGTKINEGEDDKYIAWGEGGALDGGSLPPEQRRGYIRETISTSGSGSGQTRIESSAMLNGNPLNVVGSRAYFEGMWKMDHEGGVTDGVRPDMEDSSMREAPYQGPNYGVIDTTPEVDDYTAAVRDPLDNPTFAGRGGDPVNPDNPVDNTKPGGGPPSTDPYSHDT